ncbi:serine/threonine-protein kinase PknK [Corallococcus sp. CA047B]|uniref:serine/threonine-protein kinase n=1 Tax=Corallococcus sp. CA047B TaxID=2316729 RepID=UPI000EA3BE19|nr:serine/threonine-protein kinase [Corallococcus sp. CA047B]RKH21373.1 serine/threonine-protein kinase PknK [Corallococcus sp. CA047B]
MTVLSHQDESSAARPFRVGPYRITGLLGRGGMGVVYRAEHPEQAAPVALKTVRAPSEVLLAGIRREIHALRRLDHPGIARILDEGLSHGLPYYVMELFEGGTLRSRLGAPRWSRSPESSAGGSTGTWLPTSTDATMTSPLAEPHSIPVTASKRPRLDLPALRAPLSLVRALCAPLAHLHGEGLVHRDLKPENIFIRDDGRPVLVDFGIAASFSGAASREELAAEGRVMGSVAYMAPEQLQRELVDARADLYALGCILYECLVGRPPFIGSWAGSIMFQHLNEAPVPPSRHVEGVPEELERLVLRLLEKHPNDRLGYAEDVAGALDTMGVEGDGREGLPRPRSYLYRPGLEGRAGPMEELGDALEQLRRERRGQLILLEGESGVGKTRLALELALLAHRRQVRVVTGQCAPWSTTAPEQDGAAVPLHPFRPLLQLLADSCRARGATAAERLLGTGGRWLALFEPSLAELPWVEEQPELPALPPAAAQQRILETLRKALLGLCEEQPILLVLDDLQWADELSLAVLKALAARGGEPGLLILGTYRLGETGMEFTELLSAPGARRIPLGRLERESVAAMVAGMLALRESPEALVAFLADSSSGNPFFIAEYLRAVIDEGLLARDRTGAWHLRQPDERADSMARHVLLPRTLAELIERRLSALGGDGQQLVECAAVLGREFDGALLPTLAGLSETAALDALGELRRRQFIEETPSGRLSFVHDKLRETAYARTALERRRELHLHAARWLEARSQDLPDAFPELGHHFSRAGIPDKARLYLGRAADRARVTYANGEAIRLYQAALKEAPGARNEHFAQEEGWRTEALPLHESLGDVLALVGRHEEARAAYAQALACPPRERGLVLARLHRKTGKAWEIHHAHDEALLAYGAAEQALGAPALEAEEAWWNEWLHIQIEQLAVHYWTARLDVMEALSRRIAPTVERHGTPLQRARFFEVRVQRNLRAERYLPSAETVRFARDYLRASESSGDPDESAEAGCVLACVLLWHGMLEEAGDRILATVERAIHTGDMALEVRGLTYLTQFHRRRRAVEVTRDCAERSLRAAEAGRMTSYVGAAHANLGWVALRAGHPEDAKRHCQAALQHWDTTSLIYPFEWMALLPLALLELRSGRAADAALRVARLLKTTQQRLPDTLAVSLLQAHTARDIESALQEAERAGYL